MALMFLNGDGMHGGRAHYTIELSIIELEGGELSFAMVLRDAEHDLGIHKDITSYGGWRAYRASLASRGHLGQPSSD